MQKRKIIPQNTVFRANVSLDGPSVNEDMNVVLDPLKTDEKRTWFTNHNIWSNGFLKNKLL